MARRQLMLASLASLVSVSYQQSCSVVYAQCGGLQYTGPTCCVTGTYCSKQNEYYSQCLPGSASSSTSSAQGSSGSSVSGTVPPISSSSVSSAAGTTITTPYTTTTVMAYTGTASVAHSQSPYPSNSACTGATCTDNIQNVVYCSNQNESQSCGSDCTGECTSPPSEDCASGNMWRPEVHSIPDDDPDWHYSRSTHYGITSAGACGFGLYGLCTSTKDAWIDTMLGTTCTAFCAAYPTLCQDPSSGPTLRGNFAAPNGDYYTQFWNSLTGDRDNYFSCGECFELIRTKPDGTDYAIGDPLYADPIILEVTDSCPCYVNSKWCCGSGADHCGEIDFKYGCPLPEGSHHLDLGDIAMGRLQQNGTMTEGVIPTRYKRVSCPKPGNVYIYMHNGGGPYYVQLNAVNAGGIGSVVAIEVKGAGMTDWVPMIQGTDYPTSHPQERYGAWVFPTTATPINVPIGVRVTSATGEQLVHEQLITTFTAPATAPSGWWYLDMGLQFSE